MDDKELRDQIQIDRGIRFELMKRMYWATFGDLDATVHLSELPPILEHSDPQIRRAVQHLAHRGFLREEGQSLRMTVQGQIAFERAALPPGEGPPDRLAWWS